MWLQASRPPSSDEDAPANKSLAGMASGMDNAVSAGGCNSPACSDASAEWKTIRCDLMPERQAVHGQPLSNAPRTCTRLLPMSLLLLAVEDPPMTGPAGGSLAQAGKTCQAA